MELEGKIALVTGAGDGIGKGIALTFAREGADVAANDVNLEAAEATAADRWLFRPTYRIRTMSIEWWSRSFVNGEGSISWSIMQG